MAVRFLGLCFLTVLAFKGVSSVSTWEDDSAVITSRDDFEPRKPSPRRGERRDERTDERTDERRDDRRDERRGDRVKRSREGDRIHRHERREEGNSVTFGGRENDKAISEDLEAHHRRTAVKEQDEEDEDRGDLGHKRTKNKKSAASRSRMVEDRSRSHEEQEGQKRSSKASRSSGSKKSKASSSSSSSSIREAQKPLKKSASAASSVSSKDNSPPSKGKTLTGKTSKDKSIKDKSIKDKLFKDKSPSRSTKDKALSSRLPKDKTASGSSASRRSALSLPTRADLGRLSGVPKAPMTWSPKKNKYLLLWCAFGRMSNQVACLKKTLRLAALLNRTLLLPPKAMLMFQGHVDEVWPVDLPLDWERIKECLRPAYGNNTIMTFDQYLARHKKEKKVNVKKFFCAVPGSPSNCAHPHRIKAMNRILGKQLQLPQLKDYPAWMERSPFPKGKFVSDDEVASAFKGINDDILCVGEMFAFMFQTPQGGIPLTRPKSCNNLWRPHKAVATLMDTLVNRMLKPRYAAVHLRRGDFYLETLITKKLNRTKSAYQNYSPVAELAHLVAKKMQVAKLNTLFVASDAGPVELKLFKSILQDSFSESRVVSLDDLLGSPIWLAKQPWAKESLRIATTSPTGIPWVLADKGICARANMFLGTVSSSFSGEIIEMRCEDKQTVGQDKTSLWCTSEECRWHVC